MVPNRYCQVSYTDGDGFRHSIEVQAETLYESVAMAAKAFREHGCEPGPGHKLEIEVKGPAVKHEVTLGTVRKWADQTAKSPAEIMIKKRVKAMLVG